MHSINRSEHPEIDVIEQRFGLTRRTAVKPPFFYLVTLRDGNQALRHPWGLEQKKRVFSLNCQLGVQGIELGYPFSSTRDYDAFCEIAQEAPKDMVIGGLARCDERDIRACAQALKSCPDDVIPRLHTFLGMSDFHMEHALHKKPDDILRMATDAVVLARELMGARGQVQFSPEHFGDCVTNLDWVIESIQKIIAAGRVDVVNLPNTVERTRPEVYAHMVSRVIDALPENVVVAVHPHNDLDMGTATAVAGYFAGADQIEVTDNGLGERPGNSKLHTVAVALFNNGVPIDLNMKDLYPVALEMAALSGIPIHEKEPLIGSDVRSQRSGIHQSGSERTKAKIKGAYRPIDWRIIGRPGDDEIEFTSQSGYSGAMSVLAEGGRIVRPEVAKMLTSGLVAASELYGKLLPSECVAVYDAHTALAQQKSELTEADIRQVAIQVLGTLREDNIWKIIAISYYPVGDNRAIGYLKLGRNGSIFEQTKLGDGPVDALFGAISEITGCAPKLDNYDITPISDGPDAQGTATVGLSMSSINMTATWSHTDVVKASAYAYLEALNDILREHERAE